MHSARLEIIEPTAPVMQFALGRTDQLMAARLQRFVGACKLLRGTLETAIKSGLVQVAAYIARGSADEGHLVILDRDKRLSKDKVFRRDEIVDNLNAPMYPRLRVCSATSRDCPAKVLSHARTWTGKSRVPGCRGHALQRR